MLREIYDDVTCNINWSQDPNCIAQFNDSAGNIHNIKFTIVESSKWEVAVDDSIHHHLNTYSTIFSAFSQMFEHLYPFELTIHCNPLNEKHAIQVIKEINSIYDYSAIKTSTGFVLTRGVDVDNEILTEEPNTSLMYHKLFPDKRLLRDLESRGYTFQMGNGLKIYKQYYSSVHRGSGPSKRRTLQSIVILKDGRLFRKIPKAKWVQLADPSDQHSDTWGTLFMRKMKKHEQDRIQTRKQKLQDHRKARLTKSN